jgi:hypothetical protein
MTLFNFSRVDVSCTISVHYTLSYSGRITKLCMYIYVCVCVCVCVCMYVCTYELLNNYYLESMFVDTFPNVIIWDSGTAFGYLCVAQSVK